MSAWDPAVASLAAAAAVLFALAGVLVRVLLAVGRLSVKVETLWDFHCRRGKVDLVKSGWGEAMSPVQITVRGLSMVTPFLDVFLPFYTGLVAKKPGITESEMMFEFEKKFGDFIMEKMCLPYGISEGACLVAIMQACKMGAAGRRSVERETRDDTPWTAREETPKKETPGG